MKVLKTREEVNQAIAPLREEGKVIGFVPTMGALHQGHVSLVEASVEATDVTIASIFVNPIQFNNPKDLEKYPRNLECDFRQLEDAGCQFVFVPSVEEMYPKTPEHHYPFEGLDSCMEGEFRPGHFQGVATVVHLLFDICQCDRAFFGQKDFQQLAIIRQMVKLESLQVDIIGIPTIREADGLAMSSRNLRLASAHRSVANVLFQTLEMSKKLAGQESPERIKELAKEFVGKENLFKLEYFEIVDEVQLKPISTFESKRPAVACIAAWLGDVRLIDNMRIFS